MAALKRVPPTPKFKSLARIQTIQLRKSSGANCYTTWKVDGYPLQLVLVYHGQIATYNGSGVPSTFTTAFRGFFTLITWFVAVNWTLSMSKWEILTQGFFRLLGPGTWVQKKRAPLGPILLLSETVSFLRLFVGSGWSFFWESNLGHSTMWWFDQQNCKSKCYICYLLLLIHLVHLLNVADFWKRIGIPCDENHHEKHHHFGRIFDPLSWVVPPSPSNGRPFHGL